MERRVTVMRTEADLNDAVTVAPRAFAVAARRTCSFDTSMHGAS
jgi:hypothetical protein